MFKANINRNLMIEDTKSYDDILDVELLSFKGPFKVEDFKNSYINYLKLELYNDLKAAMYDNPEDAFNFKFSREETLEKIGNNLMQQIGMGDIVISKNITDVLYEVVSDYKPDVVYTKGLIVKRTENGYILYYAHTENDTIILTPKELSTEQGQELFYKGDNTDNYALKEFFGIPKGR